MSSAICFNLDQSKILSSGNGLKEESSNVFFPLTSSFSGVSTCIKYAFIQYSAAKNPKVKLLNLLSGNLETDFHSIEQKSISGFSYFISRVITLASKKTLLHLYQK